ncbi:HEAT repeat domain-containing protein [bacterium]|nr:HEAT repeat domain-containing protein [bacterium]
MINWILNHRSDILLFIVFSIGLQLTLIITLMGYAILNRILQSRLRKRLEKKHNTWYKALFLFLEDEINASDYQNLVLKKDYVYFGDFIKEFLLDIKGDEKSKIRDLLVELNFDNYLLKKLNRRTTWERVYAIYFLGLMDCHKSISNIRDALHDKSELVRLTAATNLMQVKDLESLETILIQMQTKTGKEYQNLLTVHLLEYGTSILKELERIFRSIELSDWIRSICVQIFGYYVYTDVQDKVIEVYTATEDPELKISCISALATNEDPTLIDFFEQQLDHNNQSIVIASVKALGQLGIATSARRLIEFVDSDDFWVAKNSIEALTQLGESGLKLLDEAAASCNKQMNRDLITEFTKQ